MLDNYSSNNDGYLVHIENETNDVANDVVGQPRYLAPEVLDHALDMNQGGGRELSLKQIDVYAMGLIFWEISRRCRDLYQVRKKLFSITYCIDFQCNFNIS